jgi:hypothetical protein
VREAVGSGAANDGINVEMDPEDHFKVRQLCYADWGVNGQGFAAAVCCLGSGPAL